jgi:hypothetical protein
MVQPDLRALGAPVSKNRFVNETVFGHLPEVLAPPDETVAAAP